MTDPVVAFIENALGLRQALDDVIRSEDIDLRLRYLEVRTELIKSAPAAEQAWMTSDLDSPATAILLENSGLRTYIGPLSEQSKITFAMYKLLSSADIAKGMREIAEVMDGQEAHDLFVDEAKDIDRRLSSLMKSKAAEMILSRDNTFLWQALQARYGQPDSVSPAIKPMGP